jgi:hypothetical protein
MANGPELENGDGFGAAISAAADAGFVTEISGLGENVATDRGFPRNNHCPRLAPTPKGAGAIRYR